MQPWRWVTFCGLSFRVSLRNDRWAFGRAIRPSSVAYDSRFFFAMTTRYSITFGVLSYSVSLSLSLKPHSLSGFRGRIPRANGDPFFSATWKVDVNSQRESTWTNFNIHKWQSRKSNLAPWMARTLLVELKTTFSWLLHLWKDAFHKENLVRSVR